MKSSIISGLVILFLLCGCSDDKKDSKKEKLSYDFSENGCPTGHKEFDSQQAYCDGLKNDQANGRCAAKQRYDEFKNACPGQSWN